MGGGLTATPLGGFMKKPLIFSDFNGLDRVEGYISLEYHGSVCDLSNQKVKLSQGLPLTVYDPSDENEVMEFDGVAEYLDKHNSWYLKYKKESFRRLLKSDAHKGSGLLNCFHCGEHVSTKTWITKNGYNLTLRCNTCGKYVLESILPPNT
jgi:hypothetical protein